jgi:hypothetical protein
MNALRLAFVVMAIVIAVVVLRGAIDRAEPVEAVAPSMDAMNLDLDSAGNGNAVVGSAGEGDSLDANCGNAVDDAPIDGAVDDGCGVLGPVEVCARINENGIQDADEDAVDTLFVDVTAVNIPTSNRMVQWTGTLVYNSSKLKISTAATTSWYIAARPGAITLDTSGNLPNTTGSFSVGARDLSGSSGAEAGSGVLGRIGVESVAGGPSVEELTLTIAGHAEAGGGGVWTPDKMGPGYIAIDKPCPPEADLKMASQSVGFPASIAVDTGTQLELGRILHNNGAESPVDTTIVTTVTLPSDCSIDGQPGSGPHVMTGPGPSLPVSVAVDASVEYTVQCNRTSNHQLTVKSCVSLGSPAIDPDHSNDCEVDVVPFAVTAVADLKIVTHNLTGFPADYSAELPYPPLLVNESQQFTLEMTFHNNGPYSLASAQLALEASVTNLLGGLQPETCQTALVPPFSLSVAFLQASQETPGGKNYHITCGTDSIGEDSDDDGLIDEDPIDGLDNDGDEQADEDSPYLLPTICLSTTINPATHLSDPQLENNSYGPTCQTIVLLRPDTDGDGVPDDVDNCVTAANATQENADTDTHGDACDNCPANDNEGQANADGDAYGDACDNCPTVATSWEVPPGDGDCDYWTDAAEGTIGTDPANDCDNGSGPDDWPPDFNNSQNIDILDILQFKPVFGGPSTRHDLNVSGGAIDILDVLATKPVFGQSCTP